MKRNPAHLVSVACVAALLTAGVPFVAGLAALLAMGIPSARADTPAADGATGRRPEIRSTSKQPEAFGRNALIEALTAGSPDAARRNPSASDPVTLGFARMLDHRPTRHAPSVPACSDADPLVAAIVEPIRDGAQPPNRAARLVDAANPERC